MEETNFEVWLLSFLKNKKNLNFIDIKFIEDKIYEIKGISLLLSSGIEKGSKIIGGKLKYIPSIGFFRVVKKINKRRNIYRIITEDGCDFSLYECRLATKEDLEIIENFEKNLTITTTGIDDINQHISSVSGKPKVRYDHLEKALRGAFSLYSKLGGKWIIYPCKVCDTFHVGKNIEQN